MKTLCTNYFMLRLTLLIAPIGIVDRANAACAPASPVNNVTVTCTGATANQDGSDGYGTNTDIGNTCNIFSSASVTGANAGLIFNTSGTVNNFGTITGAGAGNNGGTLSVSNGTVNNTGVISATGANSFGVLLFGTGLITNSGSISGWASRCPTRAASAPPKAAAVSLSTSRSGFCATGTQRREDLCSGGEK